MSNGFIYVVDAHFIDKIEEEKNPGLKCLWNICVMQYQGFLLVEENHQPAGSH
jgi:hypothetical protein